MTPAIQLLDWSKRYIADDARFCLLVGSVQTGKSFTTTLKHVLRRIETPGLSIFLSAGERQSKELLVDKVARHCEAMGVAVESSSSFFEDTTITQHEVNFKNGSRIISLPANPRTARGYSGDVLLDEFAMHQDDRAIWAAMMSRITRGYSVDVASTFMGTANKFYELAKECGLHAGVEPAGCPVVAPNGWSGHWVSIEMAVREGLQVDVEALRLAIADEEIWAQEYLCVPMAGGDEFIPLELILGCESVECPLAFDGLKRPGVYAGMDVGRVRDLSTIWILEALPGGTLLTRGVISLRRMPFAEQRSVAADVAACVDRLCIDQTGIGRQLAEELNSEFPWVEPVDFTQPVKERLAVEVKRRFEERTVLIPSSRDLRRAIQSLRRYVSDTGKMRFDAARSQHGHADEFWALALAVSAASSPGYVPLADGGLVGNTVAGNLVEAAF
jgi:phage FluMu gp28-like protein